MSTKEKSSGSNFLVQGSILAIASIISRIIGLVYRIPMTDIIGDVGNGYYGTAYEVYNVLLIISSYSLPLAVSKLVSARMAEKSRRKVYQLVKGAFVFAFISGALAAIVMFAFADVFAGWLQTPQAVYALRVLAPTLFVVAVLGVMRGFFQGLGTMLPSAISQIIEQIVNAIVSVWAAYVLYQQGKRLGAVLGNPDDYAAAYGAAGGTLGTNVGAFFGLLFVLFIFLVYMKAFKRKMKKERNVEVDSFGYTMRILIITIIPVLLSTTLYNLSGIVEQFIYKNVATALGENSVTINTWWGVFTGKYKLMVNVPISIASAMAASSVPSLTRSFGEDDMTAVRNKLRSSTRLVMIIAFPCAVGLAVLAKPIFLLLFPGTAATVDTAAMMMYVGAIAVVFYSLSTLSNGLLQGINRLRIPVTNAVIALVAHALLLVVLMYAFRMGIYAVVISNAFFALLMCFLNQFALAKYSGYHQEFFKTFLMPLACSAIMGVITGLVYWLLHLITKSNAIACILAIVVAVIVYFVSLLLLRVVSEEDLYSFPKGGLLVKIGKKLHLLRA